MLASFRSGSALALVCCSFAALQACGGRSDTEAFRLGDELPNGGTSNVGASSSTGAVSGGGKKPSGTAGSGTVAGGSSGVGGSGVAQGGAVSVGGKAQGGAAQGGTGVVTAGTGGTGIGAPITCGGSVCDGLRETCCATLGGLGCIPEDQACNGAVLNCGSSSDCEGNQVCCLSLLGDVGSGSACKDACVGMDAGRERQLCVMDADCRGNRTCRDTVFGVSVCTRF
jgi:hypothetical protein